MIQKAFIWLLLLCPLTLWAAGSSARETKAAAAQCKAVEKLLAKTPGDMSLRCRYIDLLLASGDTVVAEQQIQYALKLQCSPCVLFHKAHIAFAHAHYDEAAMAYSTALLMEGWVDDSRLYLTDSLTGGGVDMRIKVAALQDKSNAHAPQARAELALLRGDTVAGLALLQEAVVRGDTLQRVRIEELRAYTQDSTPGEVLFTIPFDRKNGVPTLYVHVNGLRIKAELDTTAMISRISGVESSFMLKNEYISSDDTKDNNKLIVRDLQLTEDIVLHDVWLHNDNKMSAPLVLSLSVFERLGKAHVNQKLSQVEIYGKKE